MIYIFIFFLLFICSYNNTQTKFRLGVLLLLVITCFRAQTVGEDTSIGYLGYYNDVIGGSDLPWVEPIWLYLNLFSIYLGMGYQGVIIFSGILTILPIAYVIDKVCKNKCLALAIYYGMFSVLVSFNLMRQCIAASWVVLAVYFLLTRKYYKYIAAIVVSILFHKSSVLSFLLLPIIRCKMKYRTVFILVIIAFIIGALLPESVFYILSFDYSEKLSGVHGFRASSEIAATFALMYDAFFLLYIYPEYEHVKSPWFIMNLMGVLIMNITFKLDLGMRIVLYFMQAQMIFVPKYLDEMKIRVNRSVIFALFFVYLFINFIRILMSQWDWLNPYMFFWEL